MIIDRIERMQQYTRNVPELYEAVKFAERVRKENLPAGKYNMENGFALVQEGITRSFDEGDFEAHRKYLDVQIIISGCEYVEYADIKDLKVIVPYDDEKDLALMNGSGNPILITQDMFYLLYPGDGHKPCCHAETPFNYKKVLVKIRIDKLIHKVDFPADRFW